MDSAEKHDASLIQSIKGATQPEAQKPIPLTGDLKQIGVDAAHVVGSSVDELIRGEGRDTRDRVASPRNPIRIVLEKLKKK